MEFGSDSDDEKHAANIILGADEQEMVDCQSLTTTMSNTLQEKLNAHNSKTPLIQEIASMDFTNEEESKDEMQDV